MGRERRATSRAGIAVVIAAGMGTGSALAQEEGTFLRRALSTIGIVEEEKPPIEYRERAPLVVPPKLELVPPQSKAGARSQAWPVDRSTLEPTEAELAAERARREELSVGLDGTHIPDVSRKKRNSGGLQSVLTDLQKQRASGDTSRKRIVGAGREGDGTHVSVEEEIDPDKGKAKLATGPEPERRRLAEPPKGYRVPPKVENVVQPVEKESPKPWDIFGIFSRRN